MSGNFNKLKVNSEKALKDKTYVTELSIEEGFGDNPKDGRLMMLCALGNFHLKYIVQAENLLYQIVQSYKDQPFVMLEAKRLLGMVYNE